MVTKQASGEAITGRQVIRIDKDELDIWPAWCVREGQLCRQCLLEGKLLCHPRFRRAKTTKTTRVHYLLRAGREPADICQTTGISVNTIYSIAHRLRLDGVILAIKPHHSAKIKARIVDYVRNHPTVEYSKVAEDFNVQATYVCRVCLAAGLRRRDSLREKKQEKIVAAIKMLKKNPDRSVISIAGELDMTPTTLERYLQGSVLPPVRLVLEVLKETVSAAFSEALSGYCCPHCGQPFVRAR